MAVSVNMPRVSAVGRATADECGRFSCGQERSPYVVRTGSFGDGQSRRPESVACIGRFSTGQETTLAPPGRNREASFAEGMCRPRA
jgi:hypothetical protein